MYIITDKRETKKNYKFAVTVSFMRNQFSNRLNPNLGKERRRGGGCGNFTLHPPLPAVPPSCWFSLNNSERVKAVNLAFSSIQ